ncbi:alpha-crystallin B chain-like [Glandiceps talaboti]
MLRVRMFPTFRLARQMAREMQEMMSEMQSSPFRGYFYPFSRDWMAMSPQQILNEHLGYMDRGPSVVSSAYYQYSKRAPKRVDVKQSEEIKTEPSAESESAVGEGAGVDKFQVSVNLSQFKPENIEVNIRGNRLQIHAKGEERGDDGMKAYREYSQQYLLPENVNMEAFTSNLSKEGVLTLEAPIEAVEAPEARNIPIHREEAPAGVENKVDAAKATETENKD